MGIEVREISLAELARETAEITPLLISIINYLVSRHQFIPGYFVWSSAYTLGTRLDFWDLIISIMHHYFHSFPFQRLGRVSHSAKVRFPLSLWSQGTPNIQNGGDKGPSDSLLLTTPGCAIQLLEVSACKRCKTRENVITEKWSHLIMLTPGDPSTFPIV